jgi:natural product precursor
MRTLNRVTLNALEGVKVPKQQLKNILGGSDEDDYDWLSCECRCYDDDGYWYYSKHFDCKAPPTYCNNLECGGINCTTTCYK